MTFSLSRLHPLVPVLHRYLLVQFIRRDIRSRYQGSLLGIGWSLLYPLLILAAYTFVFRGVFKARWPGGGDSTWEFAFQVFAGLVVFNLFGDLLGRAPRLVVEQPNLVKRVVFPLEILAWVTVGSALFHGALALLVLAVALLAVNGMLPFTAPLGLLVLAACVPWLLGLAWLLSGFGVFVRDIAHAIGPAVSMLLFLSPVLYPASALPAGIGELLWMNPLTLPIESLRQVLLQGRMPDWQALGIYTLSGLVFCWFGWRMFERVRPAFADEV